MTQRYGPGREPARAARPVRRVAEREGGGTEGTNSPRHGRNPWNLATTTRSSRSSSSKRASSGWRSPARSSTSWTSASTTPSLAERRDLRPPAAAPAGARLHGMQVHLVDGTYELFRHYYAVPSRTNGDGEEIG